MQTFQHRKNQSWKEKLMGYCFIDILLFWIQVIPKRQGNSRVLGINPLIQNKLPDIPIEPVTIL